jgi:hypothetical protein
MFLCVVLDVPVCFWLMASLFFVWLKNPKFLNFGWRTHLKRLDLILVPVLLDT